MSLGIYGRLVGVQLRSQMGYRFAFAMDFLAAALITALEYGSIALVFSRFGDLDGWSLGEVAFLYGLAEASFGLMDLIFSGFDPSFFGLQVRRGAFDQLLLRPVNITLQVLGSQFHLRRLGRVVLGFAIFASALSVVEIQWTVFKIAYVPLILVGMVCFFGGLFIVGATITFWTVESIEVINIFTYGAQTMISYPMHIYQAWIRRFFTFILPAIFLNYYPALYILDRSDPMGLPLAASFVGPLAGGIVLGLALAFWRFGIRSYQSTGT